MKRILNLICSVLLIGIGTASAQLPNLNIEGTKFQDKVYLKNLDIKVEVVGNISTTTMTMVFQNKTSQILEGTLIFPLPEGVTVSGYSLDINGKMRAAVPVDKSKGTQVFEEIERRKVDPGLLEKVEGNNFRTRIYPIPANGNRTISISYEETLLVSQGKFTYRLPMDYKQPIDNFSLSLFVWQDSKPIVEAGKDEISFDKHGNTYISKFNRTNYTANHALAFSIPAENTAHVIMQSASGSYYFTINHFLKNKQKHKKEWSNNLGIIWDASLSINTKDLAKEMTLLDAIIKDKKNLTIKIGLLNNTFNNVRAFDITDGDWSKLKTFLSNIIYDGGTNYSAIDLNKIKSDEYILFSDGLSTLSEAIITNKNKAQIHCVVSSPAADYSNLKSIALNTNAKFINLNTGDISTIKEELFEDSYKLLAIKDKDHNISQVYPSIGTKVNEHFSLAGISNRPESTITLQFGYGNTVTEEETIELDAKKHQNNEINVHKIWAQKKISELDLNYDKHKKEITELSQQFGIVTRNTSLLVLELVSDYIQYNITPPQELIAEYKKYLQQQTSHDLLREQRIAQQLNLLNTSKANMSELRKWWSTDFNISKPKYPIPDNLHAANKPLSEALMMKSEKPVNQAAKSTDVLNEVVVLGFNKNEKGASTSSSTSKNVNITSASSMTVLKNTYKPQEAQVTMIDIKNDADYMKLFTGNPISDYNIYINERKTYGGTPSFYFNMADWFMKHNDREKAMLILTSIAEIGLENISAYKILSFRLKEYNDPKLLLFVTKKLKEWRPFEQQSYRDYALALQENGKYQEALDSLYSTILNPVSNSEQMASLGMNMITLSEINNLISKNKTMINTKTIDTALIFSMPVDVRVLINWSVPQTHIDMQITDPLGEMVTYNHNRSQIGGRLDAHEIMDFGPEQFLLKKGVKGKYKIQVDYWGDSNVSPNSEPATIMAEIYIGYSGGKETRKIVCFNLSNAKIDKAEKKITIAEFEI